jgi:hypothetical protein
MLNQHIKVSSAAIHYNKLSKKETKKSIPLIIAKKKKKIKV